MSRDEPDEFASIDSVLSIACLVRLTMPAQTFGEPVPREGFVDEATDVIVTFPFSPEAIADAHAESGLGIS